MSIETAGIFRLPMSEYLADPCSEPSLSSGCAHRLVAESPFHAWWLHPRLGMRGSSMSNAADTGTTAHDLLLGGEGRICVIDPAEYRSKPTKDCPEGAIPVGWTNGAIRAARDTARSNGLTPMLLGEMAGVRAMVKAAKDYVAGSEIAGVFDSGESELTVIAKDGDAWLRCRPDWLTSDGRFHISYKTTKARVHEDNFGRVMESMGYGFSLAFYERVIRRACPQFNGTRHLILAQEQAAPFACNLFELSPEKAEIERASVEQAINLWRGCLAANTWPGYGGGIKVVSPKPWELIGEVEVAYE